MRYRRITAYRTHPLYDYACGDARFSYQSEFGVEETTRQFVYLKPDVFAVHDRIALADGARIPCWMLVADELEEQVGKGGSLAFISLRTLASARRIESVTSLMNWKMQSGAERR